MTRDAMTLGNKLRQIRERKKWTQPQAAEAIGIEQSYLSKLENHYSLPSIEVFRQILSAYDVGVAELVDELDAEVVAHLSSVTDIAEYVESSKNAKRQAKQRKLTTLVVAVSLGAGFIYAGSVELFFTTPPGNDPSWGNRFLTFLGIISLVYGFLGLLVISGQGSKRS